MHNHQTRTAAHMPNIYEWHEIDGYHEESTTKRRSLTVSSCLAPLLHNRHLSSNRNTTERAPTRSLTTLHIDRVHIKDFVHVLAEQLRLLTLRPATSEVICSCAPVRRVAVVVVC